MQVTSLERCPASVPQMAGAEGVTKQVPISARDGSPSFSFRVFTVAPGGHTPLHSHPFEHLNYIISGKGMLMDGGKGHPVKEGDFAMVLPGESHQYRNASADEPLVFICAVPKQYE